MEEAVLLDEETSIPVEELCEIYSKYQQPQDLDEDDVCRVQPVAGGDRETGDEKQTNYVKEQDGQTSASFNVKDSNRDADSTNEGQYKNRGGTCQQLVDSTVISYDGLTERLFDRYGTCKLASGLLYQGPYDKSGKPSGIGRLIFPDGSVFDGEIAEGGIGSRGILTWSDGSYYEGAFRDGLRNCYGKLFNASNGAFYSGEWLAAHPHGYGKMVYDREWTDVYEGLWYLGLPWRNGVRRWKNGNVYEGEWAAGLPHGKGEKFWAVANVRYQGEFEEGKPHGYGLMIWISKAPVGSVATHRKTYHGYFRNGLLDGHGVFCDKDGTCYEGTWQSGLKHGKFKISFRNGAVLHCSYMDNAIVEPMPRFLLKECKEKFFVGKLPGPDIHHLDDPAVLLEGGLCGFILPGTVYYLSRNLNLSDGQTEAELNGLSKIIASYTEVLNDLYLVYSRLLMSKSLDNVYQLRTFQYWQFLMDVVWLPTQKETYFQQSLYRTIISVEDCFPEENRRCVTSHPFQTMTYEQFIDRITIAAYLVQTDDFESLERIRTHASGTMTWDPPGTPLLNLIERRVLKEAGSFKGELLREIDGGVREVDRFHKVYRHIAECNRGKGKDDPSYVTIEQILSFLQEHAVDSQELAIQLREVISSQYPFLSEKSGSSLNVQMPLTLLEFVTLVQLLHSDRTIIPENATENPRNQKANLPLKGRIVEATDSHVITQLRMPHVHRNKMKKTIVFSPVFFQEFYSGLPTRR